MDYLIWFTSSLLSSSLVCFSFSDLSINSSFPLSSSFVCSSFISSYSSTLKQFSVDNSFLLPSSFAVISVFLNPLIIIYVSILLYQISFTQSIIIFLYDSITIIVNFILGKIFFYIVFKRYINCNFKRFQFAS